MKIVNRERVTQMFYQLVAVLEKHPRASTHDIILVVSNLMRHVAERLKDTGLDVLRTLYESATEQDKDYKERRKK